MEACDSYFTFFEKAMRLHASFAADMESLCSSRYAQTLRLFSSTPDEHNPAFSSAWVDAVGAFRAVAESHKQISQAMHTKVCKPILQMRAQLEPQLKANISLGRKVIQECQSSSKKVKQNAKKYHRAAIARMAEQDSIKSQRMQSDEASREQTYRNSLQAHEHATRQAMNVALPGLYADIAQLEWKRIHTLCSATRNALKAIETSLEKLNAKAETGSFRLCIEKLNGLNEECIHVDIDFKVDDMPSFEEPQFSDIEHRARSKSGSSGFSHCCRNNDLIIVDSPENISYIAPVSHLCLTHGCNESARTFFRGLLGKLAPTPVSKRDDAESSAQAPEPNVLSQSRDESIEIGSALLSQHESAGSVHEFEEGNSKSTSEISPMDSVNKLQQGNAENDQQNELQQDNIKQQEEEEEEQQQQDQEEDQQKQFHDEKASVSDPNEAAIEQPGPVLDENDVHVNKSENQTKQSLAEGTTNEDKSTAVVEAHSTEQVQPSAKRDDDEKITTEVVNEVGVSSNESSPTCQEIVSEVSTQPFSHDTDNKETNETAENDDEETF
eukprot:gene8196-10146_t